MAKHSLPIICEDTEGRAKRHLQHFGTIIMGNRSRLLQGVGVCTSFCGVIDFLKMLKLWLFHIMHVGAGMG